MWRILMIPICFVAAFLSAGESAEADAVYKMGIDKLREAQTDHSVLLVATKLLTQAAALFESSGNEAKVTEINSFIYWAKKKFTLADVSVAKTNPELVTRINVATKELSIDHAQALLETAHNYAESTTDPLLVAIRYFEVADRFKNSAVGHSAMDLSLKAMQRIGESHVDRRNNKIEQPKSEFYKTALTDGKVLVKSDPPGAEILLITQNGGKLETGKVTPSLVQLPVGFQTVELALKAHKPGLLTLEVNGKSIAKPEAVKLEALTVSADVIFQEGWQVFVNGKAARVTGSGNSETPCTIELPLGGFNIVLAKEGFLDISQRVDVKSLETKICIEPKIRIGKGKSVILSAPRPPAVAVFAQSSISKQKVEIIKAVYKAGDKIIDLTSIIQKANDSHPDLPIVPADALGGDPGGAQAKQMIVEYRLNGQTKTKSAIENQYVFLKDFDCQAIPGSKPGVNVRIISAHYGSTRKWIDVKSLVEKQLEANPNGPVAIGGKEVGTDPAPYAQKYLVVHFAYDGQAFSRIDYEERKIALVK